jgi:hypothetical protein
MSYKKYVWDLEIPLELTRRCEKCNHPMTFEYLLKAHEERYGYPRNEKKMAEEVEAVVESRTKEIYELFHSNDEWVETYAIYCANCSTFQSRFFQKYLKNGFKNYLENAFKATKYTPTIVGLSMASVLFICSAGYVIAHLSGLIEANNVSELSIFIIALISALLSLFVIVFLADRIRYVKAGIYIKALDENTCKRITAKACSMCQNQKLVKNISCNLILEISKKKNPKSI